MNEQIIIKPHELKLNFDVKPIQDVCSRKHLEDFIDFKKRSSHLSEQSAFNLRSSTCDILSFCNPHDAYSNLEATHLVVGYVQSGKTMSFISLIELALDYQYKVVIVFTGITNNLLNQTYDRLKKDLKGDNPENNRCFKIHKNPDIQDKANLIRQIRQKDSIIVISVLKHYDRIRKLTDIFNDENVRKAMGDETVLIIDDEADQASLNNFGRQNSQVDSEEYKMSTTYESIVELRNALPGNSYIQYTATPQANILINTLDILSPKTHTLLLPGDGYCGGKQFFGKGPNGELYNGKLIITIPPEEVFDKDKNNLTEMPQSLEHALMMHMWAVTIVIRHLKKEGINQLSMMVHMDETLDCNRMFYDWIDKKLTYWQDVLIEPESRQYGILMTRFRAVLSDALRFYSDEESASFEDLKELLFDTILDTNIFLITGETDDIEKLDWDDCSSNILVGAQMLNRGFTVENLATTYMSRHAVTSNADTIEQRCRFFGYKMKYIQSCRVYLPFSSQTDYETYIESEEELRLIMSKTKSMDELGHKILSSPKLKPTRTSVLSKETVTSKFKKMHEFSSYERESVMKYNLGVVESFTQAHQNEWSPVILDNYNALDFTGLRSQSYVRIPVEEAIVFLKEYVFTSSSEKRYCADSIRYLYYLSNKINDPISDVVVYNMGGGAFKERSLNTVTHKLATNLFEGQSSTHIHNTAFYPGDRNIYDNNTITIQIHRIKLNNLDIKTAALSIYYPEHLAVNYCNSDIY